LEKTFSKRKKEKKELEGKAKRRPGARGGPSAFYFLFSIFYSFYLLTKKREAWVEKEAGLWCLNKTGEKHFFLKKSENESRGTSF